MRPWWQARHGNVCRPGGRRGGRRVRGDALSRNGGRRATRSPPPSQPLLGCAGGAAGVPRRRARPVRRRSGAVGAGTRWDGVGSYRRALSAAEVKITGAPVWVHAWTSRASTSRTDRALRVAAPRSAGRGPTLRGGQPNRQRPARAQAQAPDGPRRARPDRPAVGGAPGRRGGGCAYCGATGDAACQRDCVLRISRGGRYTPRQHRARACRSCTASKCNDEVTGWLPAQAISDERAVPGSPPRDPSAPSRCSSPPTRGRARRHALRPERRVPMSPGR